LEEAKQNAQKDSEEIRKTRIELESAKAENIKLQEAAKVERERLMEKTRQESENILESARQKSNELLNQLEDIKKQITSENASNLVAKAREAARASIKSIEGNTSFSSATKEKYVLPRNLIVGDTVILQDINKKAEVVTLPDKSGKLTVIAGIMKLQTDISNIRLQEGSVTVNNRKPAKHKAVSGVLSRAERVVTTEIDLRGMACDEAIIELERFIDNAIMGGMETVHIIHGKGTGVLRKGVQTALRHNKNVKSFRLGVFGEGESGVTIATLK
jgi:DNA mismatch repair protein MutS2